MKNKKPIRGTNLYLSPAVVKAAKAVAASKGLSLSAIVAAALVRIIAAASKGSK